jgi:hypothetical protein
MRAELAATAAAGTPSRAASGKPETPAPSRPTPASCAISPRTPISSAKPSDIAPANEPTTTTSRTPAFP